MIKIQVNGETCQTRTADRIMNDGKDILISGKNQMLNLYKTSSIKDKVLILHISMGIEQEMNATMNN